MITPPSVETETGTGALIHTLTTEEIRNAWILWNEWINGRLDRVDEVSGDETCPRCGDIHSPRSPSLSPGKLEEMTREEALSKVAKVLSTLTPEEIEEMRKAWDDWVEREEGSG